MTRNAFKMKLKPGCEREYRRRHDEIWPDLVTALKKAGIYDYSIFLDEETNILFAVQKLEEGQDAGRLPELDLMQRWWEHMEDLMEVEEDGSPVEVELKEMFHMD